MVLLLPGYARNKPFLLSTPPAPKSLPSHLAPRRLYTFETTSPDLGYPMGDGTPAFEDNKGTINSICSYWIHDNIRHLATKISWLNELYTAGILKLLYTKTTLELDDCNTKPLCCKSFKAMLSFLLSLWYSPLSDSKHYQSLYLEDC
jgi:hypothetical protein